MPRNTRPNISTLSSTSSGAICTGDIPAARGALAGKALRPIHCTSRPSGTFTANSQGHEATDNTAAATDGPATEDAATTSELMAIPRPSRWRGNTSRTSAMFTAISPAAPMPCRARMPTSMGSEVASAQPSEAAVNTAMPPRYTFR